MCVTLQIARPFYSYEKGWGIEATFLLIWLLFYCCESFQYLSSLLSHLLSSDTSFALYNHCLSAQHILSLIISSSLTICRVLSYWQPFYTCTTFGLHHVYCATMCIDHFPSHLGIVLAEDVQGQINRQTKKFCVLHTSVELAPAHHNYDLYVLETLKWGYLL